MSIFYKKSNKEGARDLFGKSFIYKSDIRNAKYLNLIDFDFAEKYLYGRVDRDYVPFELNAENMQLTTLLDTNTSDKNLQAASFVAAAFKDLTRQFDRKAATGQISTNEQYLSKLEVAKAYENPRTLYNKHLQTMKSSIIAFIEDEDINFSNFNEFIKKVEPVIIKTAQSVPFTYSGFIKSKYCPMNVSGLVIEIATADSSNDEEKVRAFQRSKNWEFYLNACLSYGFSVDLNNPWRLIADIGSNEMLQYAAAGNYGSTNAILRAGYSKAHRTFFPSFASILLGIYDDSKGTYIETEYCQDGSTIAKVIEPNEYSQNNIGNLMSEGELLNLYMKIRLAEDETILEDQQKERLMRRINQIHRVKSISSALSAFEISIGETFNESGSLTDLIYRVKIRKQEE